ncbi:MAG: endolytic transglycosylase MltG [Rhodospirillaceae bacterium]|jgi:UPF0755 protein|nr:endolytic transglycosylase MltG [Rhodospirillaceae bacterium]
MKRLLVVFTALLLLGVAVLAGGWLWLQNRVQSAGPLGEETIVVIELGSNLGSVARDLQRTGIVRSELAFRLHARLMGYAAQLKAGEYRFGPGVSPGDVLAKIVAHDVAIRFVTIPEGLTSSQVVQLIKDADGLTGDLPRRIEDGTLLPETYGYERGESRSALVRRMRIARDDVLSNLWAGRASDLPLDSPEDALILASIVEKETSVAQERPRVAAVFVNRLRRGMRLQSDPTVAYGVDPTGPLGRPLRRSDLNGETPYNTYKVLGLPPGPICHPGRDSIAAVLNPSVTKDLYFVADGSGGHAFAVTLADHNRNVARWRRIQRGNVDR